MGGFSGLAATARMAPEPEKDPQRPPPNEETWISGSGAQSLSSANDGGLCSPLKHQKSVKSPTSNLSCDISTSSKDNSNVCDNNDVSGAAAAAEDLRDAAEKGRSKTKIALIMLALSVWLFLHVVDCVLANYDS